MTFGSPGTASTAATRPLIPAGPIDRASIPASRPGSIDAPSASGSGPGPDPTSSATNIRTDAAIEIDLRGAGSVQRAGAMGLRGLGSLRPQAGLSPTPVPRASGRASTDPGDGEGIS